jgi:glycosyltransferase A (GT-A) superfamily protein (DUF2064 family)
VRSLPNATATRPPALLVMAKSPIAGRVKTRCTPPCTPDQAAAMAEAALHDTLRVALAVPAARHVLALDGPVGPWLPAGFDVVPQVGRGLGERLDRAFADVAGPVLMISAQAMTPSSGSPPTAASGRRVCAARGRACSRRSR